MSDHAEYSPSSLASFELCPRFEKSTSDEVHPVTAEGTLLHDRIEREDTEGLTPAQKNIVEDCIAFTKSVTEGADEHHREARLDIGLQDDGSHLTFGTVDHVAIGGDTAVVVDYKTGYNGIDAADKNAQGAAYTLGVMEKWPHVEKVVLWFYLPRRGEQTSHTYTRKDEPHLRLRLETIIGRAKDKSIEATPSPAACQYCAAKTQCPSLARNALVLAEKYKDTCADMDATTLAEVHSSKIADPSQMAKALAIASVMEDWAKSVKHHARTLVVEDGVEIPGYKIIQRQGTASVTGSADEVYNTVGAGQLSEQEFISCTKVDLKKLTALLAEKAPRGQKGATKDNLIDVLESLGLAKRGSPTNVLMKERKKTN